MVNDKITRKGEVKHLKARDCSNFIGCLNEEGIYTLYRIIHYMLNGELTLSKHVRGKLRTKIGGHFCWKWGNPQCFHLPPGFWPMGGLGISSVPHLTITSPLVNRSCSSHWNYRRCQSPHKGCRLAPASKLIIREKPGSHPSRLTQSLQKATPPFRCSLYSQVLLTWQPFPPLFQPWPTAGKYHSTLFSYQTPECVTARWCMRTAAGLWPNSVSPSSPSTRVHIPGATRLKNRGYGWPRDWTQDLSDKSLAPYRSELSGQPHRRSSVRL